MSTNFEQDIYKQLQNNSIIFLNDGVERLLNKDNGDVDFIENDLLVLTCTSFQISIELAIKALILERYGIRKIIEVKYRTLSDNEIQELFLKNNLRTLEFDTNKNFIKTQKLIEDLTKDDFKIIDEFQKYRNRIAHFTYNFDNSDLYDFKDDLVYYLIHIIFKILLSKRHQDQKPSEFLAYTLNSDLHDRIIKYRPYIKAMEKLANDSSTIVLKCAICFNRTLSQDEDYCYCCNSYFDDFTLIDCDYCDGKKTFIYDNLNIDLNDNIAKGICLNCDDDGLIFECPECGIAHNMEARIRNVCTSEKCINDIGTLELE